MKQNKDPATNPQASVQDFVYRLRRMGYPGNVRVEFPIYTVEDVRWTAKVVSDAAHLLIEAAQNTTMNPLQRVLAARGIAVHMDSLLKRRTNHRKVASSMRQI